MFLHVYPKTYSRYKMAQYLNIKMFIYAYNKRYPKVPWSNLFEWIENTAWSCKTGVLWKQDSGCRCSINVEDVK